MCIRDRAIAEPRKEVNEWAPKIEQITIDPSKIGDAVSYTHLDVYKRQVYDLFIACDCSDTGRLGSAAKYFESAKRTLCIDHHVTNRCV